MIHLEWIFLTQLLMGVLMILFLQKLTQIKKQIDGIVKEVGNYISYITEEEGANVSQPISSEDERKRKDKNMGNHSKEESQNQLIQEVLREYFP